MRADILCDHTDKAIAASIRSTSASQESLREAAFISYFCSAKYSSLPSEENSAPQEIEPHVECVVLKRRPGCATDGCTGKQLDGTLMMAFQLRKISLLHLPKGTASAALKHSGLGLSIVKESCLPSRHPWHHREAGCGTAAQPTSVPNLRTVIPHSSGSGVFSTARMIRQAAEA
jgi:hypothetical protein